MRKLFSLKIELRVLRTICLEPESRAAREFLAKLSEEHFASEVSRVAFKRIRHNLKRSSSVPDWDDLVTDPKIDESIQEVLEECDYSPLLTKKKVKGAISRLQEYRKLRVVTKIGARAERIINGTDPINIDDEISEIQKTLSSTKSTGNFKILRIGVNSNVLKQVDKMLKGTVITYLPTGFKGFDSINKGIPAGSFMLVAGPTGSGKSALLAQLCSNFAMAGAKVGTAPLEMSNNEMLQRHMARVGQIDMTKLLDPENRISKREAKEIFESFVKYDKKMAKIGGSLEYYEFDEGVTVESLTATVEPFDLDVLAIDYLGLLDETSGERQWQYMMDAARYLHVWGKSRETSTVAAAQLSEDGMLRYSKGLAEHAKFFWNWKVDAISKQTGIFEINQTKARQASDHSFMLQFNMPTMTIKDATEDSIREARKLREESGGSGGSCAKGGKKNKSTEKKWKSESNLSWDDDDDNPKPKPGKKAHHDVKKKKRPPKREVEL